MNITVYLAANHGNNPDFVPAVRELGRWIGQSGNALVYGGSRVGLMGELAMSALEAGAHVTGVEPEFFMAGELQLDEVSELIVTQTMAERRAKMIELGDAFVVFPGGVGTLEEVAEVMCMLSLGHLDAPCVFYNLGGFYDLLRAHLEQVVAAGLCTNERLANVHFASSLDEVAAFLGQPRA